jgi:hypothetical protein
LQGRSGQQRKRITVQSNDPDQPRFQLQFSGKVVQELTLVPRYLSFGRVAPDTETERTVTLNSLRPGTRILEANCDSTVFDVTMVTTNGGPCTGLVVRTCPPLKPGALSGTVRVKTDHPTYPLLRLPVHAAVSAPLNVLPAKLVLRKGAPRPVSRAIVVRPGTIRSFTVREVITPSEETPARVEKLQGGVYRITVRNLTADDALDGKSVRILTDSKQMPEIRVPIDVLP